MADIYNDHGRIGEAGGNPETLPGVAYSEEELPPPGPVIQNAASTAGDMPDWQRALSEWVKENQLLAMAGGFALGVFIGVLIRD